MEYKQASIKAEINESGDVSSQIKGPSKALYALVGIVIRQLAMSVAKNGEDLSDTVFTICAICAHYALCDPKEATFIDLSKVAKNNQGGTTL